MSQHHLLDKADRSYHWSRPREIEMLINRLYLIRNPLNLQQMIVNPMAKNRLWIMPEGT